MTDGTLKIDGVIHSPLPVSPQDVYFVSDGAGSLGAVYDRGGAWAVCALGGAFLVLVSHPEKRAAAATAAAVAGRWSDDTIARMFAHSSFPTALKVAVAAAKEMDLKGAAQ